MSNLNKDTPEYLAAIDLLLFLLFKVTPVSAINVTDPVFILKKSISDPIGKAAVELGGIVTVHVLVESKVTYIKVNQVENTTVYNDDIQNRISNTEEILILRNNEYIMERTDSVVLGDKIVKIIDNKEIHEIVNKVDSIKETRNVYEFGREVFGLLDIKGVLVYHLYPID